MNSTPRISETEWIVMKVLWRKSPLTANQVIEELSEKVDWSPLTIRTLLTRLAGKNALEIQKKDGVYNYYPIVSERDCSRAETKSFLKRVYDGTFKSMMASFLEEQELSDEDIAELKRILDGKKPEER